jgi:hypothetical protein
MVMWRDLDIMASGKRIKTMGVAPSQDIMAAMATTRPTPFAIDATAPRPI